MVYRQPVVLSSGPQAHRPRGVQDDRHEGDQQRPPGHARRRRHRSPGVGHGREDLLNWSQQTATSFEGRCRVRNVCVVQDGNAVFCSNPVSIFINKHL